MNKNRKNPLLVAAIMAFTAVGIVPARENVTAIANFEIVNHKGLPVPDVTVSSTFRYITKNPYSRKYQKVDGITDAKGNVSLTGETYGRLDYEVYSPAIYSASRRLAFKGSTLSEKVVVYPKLNPIPLVAMKGVKKKFPVIGEEVGFDLLKVDWMPPYGAGERQDIVLLAKGEMGPDREFLGQTYWSTMSVKFPGPGNGIRFMTNRNTSSPSVMRSEYKAPAAGYLSSAVFESFNGFKAKTRYRKAEVQYIRIRRGKKDSMAGLYGKIYGNMIEMTEEGPVLVLEYLFINPTPGDRNVEFDPTQNLAADYNPVVPAKSLKVEIP